MGEGCTEAPPWDAVTQDRVTPRVLCPPRHRDLRIKTAPNPIFPQGALALLTNINESPSKSGCISLVLLMGAPPSCSLP